MADHIDRNAETAENKSLDQSAIDEALAEMQIDDSGDSAAGIEPAAHSNGGDTFAATESDGTEDLDAAIAALQADVDTDEVAAEDDPDENGDASQADIDAALAAMQDDATSAEEAAESEPGESGDASQADIDAALAAMQDDATSAEEAAESEPAESGETSQEDIDAALAAMQADVTSVEEAAESEPAESGEASQEDIDAALAAMQADVTSVEEAAESEPDETGEASQDDIDAAFAAAQTDAEPEEDATDIESTESGDASQEDADVASAAMQADTATEEEAVETDSPETGDASQEDINAAIAAMQEDGSDGVETEEVPETDTSENDQEDDAGSMDASTGDGYDQTAEMESETVEEPLMAEPQASAVDAGPTKSSDGANTFSGLDEEDLTNGAPPRNAPVANESTEVDTAPGDENDFTDLDDDASDLAAANTSKQAGAVEAASAGSGDSQSEKVVESLPEVTANLSDSKTADVAGKSRGSGRMRMGIIVLCLAVLAGSAAYWGRDLYSAYKAKAEPVPAEIPQSDSVPAKMATPQPQPVVTQNPYREKLQEVARLRADLLSKKDEIDRLRQFYRDGISELEEELQQEATKHGVQKLSEAIANHKIELDLQSIRRRWAYIDELAKPYHWLQQGSEELLFLSRRTEIDLQMDVIASGIELTKHMRRLNASLQKYQLSPERLAIDISNSRLRPVEEIWQAISTQNKTIARKAVANGDQAIIDEICSGDTGRIAELTTLTIKASKCLSELDTSELFLNRLTFLSPVAAKYLSNWKGQWLCLNGFQELTPDVARHLFRWGGKWISLNGLEDFNPQLGELLLAWEGDQLELMGLVYKADQAEKIGLQQLFNWEKAGGKLFVPEPIRAEMAKLN